MSSVLSNVRHASELTPELIQQFPYDLQYKIHRLSLKPDTLVMMARIAAHDLEVIPSGKSELWVDFEHALAKQLSEAGFIRDDLDRLTIRIIWLYQIVAEAPKGWFNQVYEIQPNLNPDFIHEIDAAMYRTFQDNYLVKEAEELFGLRPEQLDDTEEAMTVTSSPRWSRGRKDPLYRHRLATVLPSFHGLGGPAPDRISELLTELTQLLEQNCLPDVKVGYVRHQLRELADMPYGPDLGELERAYQQPLSQLWLRPETYGVLHELGFETVGDVLANSDALVDEYLPPSENVANRLILSELRDSLRCSGYTVNFPALSIAQP